MSKILNIGGKEMKEADRSNDGKVELSLLPKTFLEETAKVLMFGARKYDRNNWKKGCS